MGSMTTGDCPLLALPFEVRQTIYEQLLTNLIIHPCPDRYRLHHSYASTSATLLFGTLLPKHQPNGRTYGNFYDDLMDCSSRHYQSLIRPGQWSNVCSSKCSFKACDIVHFMLACKTICLELESLFWSSVTFAVGLPTFGMFYERFLSLPLRSRLPQVVSRAEVLSKLILSLPRTDELASHMGRDRRYHYGAHDHLEQKVKQSLHHLTRSCPSIRTLHVIMDVTQFEPSNDPHQIIAYVRHDVEDILQFNSLEHFEVTYSGSFPSNFYDEHHTLEAPLSKKLESCAHALWEMLTSRGEPLDPSPDRTGWLGDDYLLANEDPPLSEFCARASRHYNTWWMSLDVDEKKTILWEG